MPLRVLVSARRAGDDVWSAGEDGDLGPHVRNAVNVSSRVCTNTLCDDCVEQS